MAGVDQASLIVNGAQVGVFIVGIVALWKFIREQIVVTLKALELAQSTAAEARKQYEKCEESRHSDHGIHRKEMETLYERVLEMSWAGGVNASASLRAVDKVEGLVKRDEKAKAKATLKEIEDIDPKALREDR